MTEKTNQPMDIETRLRTDDAFSAFCDKATHCPHCHQPLSGKLNPDQLLWHYDGLCALGDGSYCGEYDLVCEHPACNRYWRATCPAVLRDFAVDAAEAEKEESISERREQFETVYAHLVSKADESKLVESQEQFDRIAEQAAAQIGLTPDEVEAMRNETNLRGAVKL